MDEGETLDILTEPGGEAARDEGPFIKRLLLHIFVIKCM